MITLGIKHLCIFEQTTSNACKFLINSCASSSLYFNVSIPKIFQLTNKSIHFYLFIKLYLDHFQEI